MKPPGQFGGLPGQSTRQVPGASRPPGADAPSVRKPAIMQEPVLVLNATFEPINVTAVRRAMVLMLKGVTQAGRDQPHQGAFGLPIRWMCPR